jgi:histidyl-tRNA synthetase
MRRADASGAQVAVIVGDEEAAAREASVKPLRVERAQIRLALDVLPNNLSQLLYADDD